jgi:hypothetical protein
VSRRIPRRIKRYTAPIRPRQHFGVKHWHLVNRYWLRLFRGLMESA